MRKVFTLVLFTLFLAAAVAKDNRAILPFTAQQETLVRPSPNPSPLSRNLRCCLTQCRSPRISPAIRNEQDFPLGSGMTAPDTAAALVKQVDVQYVVSGSITALGKQKLLLIAILKIDDLRQIAWLIQPYTHIEEMQNKLPSMLRNIVVAVRKDTSQLPRLAILPLELSCGSDLHAADTLAQALAVYHHQEATLRRVSPHSRSSTNRGGVYHQQPSLHHVSPHSGF